MLEPEVEGKAVQESENEPEALDRIHAESREKIQCSQEICIHDQSGGRYFAKHLLFLHFCLPLLLEGLIQLVWPQK